MRYKPSNESKIAEGNIKSPLILEHNVMGAKFSDGKISPLEWKTFQSDWLRRLRSLMHNVVKSRVYVEDTSALGSAK